MSQTQTTNTTESTQTMSSAGGGQAAGVVTGAQTYEGGCHCGAVRYRATIDLAAGTSKCNCGMCQKSGNWGVILKPEAFTLLRGEEALTDYQYAGRFTHLVFCRTCGIRSFGRGNMPWLGGDFVTVNLNCVDDIDLSRVLIRHFDGRHDDWQNVRLEQLG